MDVLSRSKPAAKARVASRSLSRVEHKERPFESFRANTKCACQSTYIDVLMRVIHRRARRVTRWSCYTARDLRGQIISCIVQIFSTVCAFTQSRIYAHFRFFYLHIFRARLVARIGTNIKQFGNKTGKSDKFVP